MYTGTLHLFPAPSGVYRVGAKSLKIVFSQLLCQKGCASWMQLHKIWDVEGR